MNRQDNRDELRAEKWLARQGCGKIRRVCCDPPDYVVENRYAVEVTRLNERITPPGRGHSMGEEEFRIPLTDSIRNALENLGSPSNEGVSWIVNCEYDFNKPRPKPNMIASQIQGALNPLTKPYDDQVVSSIHRKHTNYQRHAGEIAYLHPPHICLPCGICLELYEFHHSPSQFIVANVSNGHGIGIAEELLESIQNRVTDKSQKVRDQGKIEQYEQWWLVLVDHVCHIPIQCLSEEEKALVRNQQFDFWSRIVIISSGDFEWSYDLVGDGEDNVRGR